jgi:hypothetical protein
MARSYGALTAKALVVLLLAISLTSAASAQATNCTGNGDTGGCRPAPKNPDSDKVNPIKDVTPTQPTGGPNALIPKAAQDVGHFIQHPFGL